MSKPDPLLALIEATRELAARNRRFALVGGLAVSIRSEVRFTRDVDIAVIVEDDVDAEGLIYELKASAFVPIVTVENDAHSRLATVRLQSTKNVIVALLFASSGIETEVVTRASNVKVTSELEIPVAATEELIAMKVLSMSDQRLQDHLDVQRLIQYAIDLDIDRIRHNLRLICERSYNRDQDLLAKFDRVLSETTRSSA